MVYAGDQPTPGPNPDVDPEPTPTPDPTPDPTPEPYVDPIPANIATITSYDWDLYYYEQYYQSAVFNYDGSISFNNN